MDNHIKRNNFTYIKHLLISVLFTMLFAIIDTYGKTLPSNVNFRIYNDKLIAIYSACNENLSQARSPLKIKKNNDSIIEINNCLEYIEQLKYVTDSQNTINKRINSEYQVCLQLKSLKQSVKAKHSFWKEDSLSLFIYKYLDLSSFRSSLRPRWSGKDSFSLENFDFDSVNTGPYTITIETKNWLYIFDILAKGDINHDGYEDLLVSFLDDSKKGTYFSLSTLLLIFKNENDRRIIATKIEDILKYSDFIPDRRP